MCFKFHFNEGSLYYVLIIKCIQYLYKDDVSYVYLSFSNLLLKTQKHIFFTIQPYLRKPFYKNLILKQMTQTLKQAVIATSYD